MSMFDKCDKMLIMDGTVETSLEMITHSNNLMKEYLSYRACGFTVQESCQLAGVTYTTIKRWRDSNEAFAKLDTNVKDLIKQFSYNYIELEFIRNFRLILKKDYDVLTKSIYMPDLLTRGEEMYLSKIRSQYTPDQLMALKRILSNDDLKDMNFTQLVLQFGDNKCILSNNFNEEGQTEGD